MDATGSSFSYSNSLAALERNAELQGGTKWPIDMIIPRLIEGPPQKRERRYFRTLNQDYSSNGQNVIKFEIKSTNFADFRMSYLKLRAEIITSDGTYKAFPNGVWNIFKRVTIRTGGRVYECENYGLLLSFWMTVFCKKQVATFLGRPLWGFGLTSTERRSQAKSAQNFELPILLPLMTQSMLPVGALTDLHTLEFELDDPENFLETDATNPYIKITNCKLPFDDVEATSAYANLVSAMTSSANGLSIDVRDFDHYVNYVSGSNSNVEIDYRGTGVEAVYSIMRDDTILRTMDVDKTPAARDRIYNWQQFGLQDFALRFNNRLWPADPVICANGDHEPWIEYLKAMGKFHVSGCVDDTAAIECDEFLADRFVIVNNLVQHPGDPAFTNPVSTLTNQNTINLELRFSNPPVGKIRIDTWVKHAGRYNINRGRIINQTT